MTQWLEETVGAVGEATVVRDVEPTPGSFLRPGEQFGPWRLIEHLADGGFGSVWRAAATIEVHTERRVVGVGENAAVKFFAATTDVHRRRIAREVSLAQRLGGHWTPEHFGSDLDAIPQWAAFEFVADATLRDLVRSTGPLTGESLEVFAEDLWDALAFFRRHGVAHRDLTPANVHVNARSAKPRVIDWGNAGEAHAETASAALPRTPGYAAPEQVEGRAAGPAADLWSWAAVVCFAATGHPPLPVDGYHHAVIACDVPLDLSGVPAALLPALDAALRWDPDDRDPDAVAAHLPGRRAHVELEAVRAREAELDHALDDLRRRVTLRDERIEELDELIARHEAERRHLLEVGRRLAATERDRDDAAREATTLRARVAELENEVEDLHAVVPVMADTAAALRRAERQALRDRLVLARLRWSHRRLERRVAAHDRRRGQVRTLVPAMAAGAIAVATTAVALLRASWESSLYVGLFVLLAGAGVALASRVTARSGQPVDRARAGARGVARAVPLLLPLLFSAGALPSTGLATWLLHAPFVTPPPPDGLGVGHGARSHQVDPDDCTAPAAPNSYWDVVVVRCPSDP